MKKGIFFSFLTLFAAQTAFAGGVFSSLGNFIKKHRVASAIIGVGVGSQVGLFGLFHLMMSKENFRKIFDSEKTLLNEVVTVGKIDIGICADCWPVLVPTSLILFGILNKAEKDSLLKPFFLRL